MSRRASVSATLAGLLIGTVIAFSTPPVTDLLPVNATATPRPTRCEGRRINLSHPELADHVIECAAADATATAYIHVQVTVTPCDPWDDRNVTPIPAEILPRRLAAPCGVVAFDATRDTHAATVTAGIIDGSLYGLHIQNGAPYWTPTIYPYGTVPPDVLAGYPLTLTAIPWGTPHGWCLDGDRWVTTCGNLP